MFPLNRPLRMSGKSKLGFRHLESELVHVIYGVSEQKYKRGRAYGRIVAA